MHSDTANRFTPTAVTRMTGSAIEKFCFSSKMSLCLVLTKVGGVRPAAGPLKSFGELEVTGCGFWDERDLIVVRFTKELLPDSPAGLPLVARSCPGRFVRPGVLQCRPPRMGDPGRYQVSVAMNGKDFTYTPSSVGGSGGGGGGVFVTFYPEPVILTLTTPLLLDLKEMGGGASSMLDVLMVSCKRTYIHTHE